MDEETGELKLGIARCGDIRFAIPMSHLAEVAQVQQLAPMLQTAVGLQGALNLRGGLVPVFDLSVLTGGTDTPGDTPPFAAILRSEGALLGLGIDQVEGLIRIPRQKLQDMSNAEPLALDDASQPRLQHPSIIRGALLHEERLISVIAPDALFDNPALLSTRRNDAGTKTRRASHAAAATSQADRPVLIFSSGGTEYALLATAIQGTVPKTTIEENALTSGACIGSIQYHGQRAPVLRTQGVTGLGQPSRTRASEIVMLRLDDGARVGLAVDSIEQMRTARHAQLRTVPPAIATSDSVVSGVLPSGSGARQTFLICPDKLRTHDLIREMAQMSLVPNTARTKDAEVSKHGADVVSERVRHLIFDAGTPLAAPAEQILRILRPPEIVTEWNAPAVPGVEGVFRVEDGPVLYVDLARRLGLRPDVEARERVLLVAHKEHRVGFAVRDVQGIDTSRWRRTARSKGHSGMIVQLGSGPQRRILPALDMQRLAAGLCA